jgi:recombination protein RecA
MKQQSTKTRPSLTPEAELSLIRKKLKHFTTEKAVKYWLDTGSPLLNSVFGSEEKGLPYGKMFELAGMESQGKTALMMWLGGLAQKDGAKVGWVDLENSWDPEWATALGLDPEQVYLFKPQIGTFGKETEERQHTAEELLTEVEEWIKKKGRENPDGRIFCCVDSIAAMLTEEEAAGGIQDQNMRTKVSLASFLSQLLRRWVALVANYNVMLPFINQLRVAPGAWGNPEYTPGGNAVKLYASVRVRMRRKSKKILKGGKAIGIKGTLTNWKNKAGSGSREGLSTGYKLYYKGKLKYIPAEDVKNEGTEA